MSYFTIHFIRLSDRAGVIDQRQGEECLKRTKNCHFEYWTHFSIENSLKLQFICIRWSWMTSILPESTFYAGTILTSKSSKRYVVWSGPITIINKNFQFVTKFIMEIRVDKLMRRLINENDWSNSWTEYFVFGWLYKIIYTEACPSRKFKLTDNCEPQISRWWNKYIKMMEASLWTITSSVQFWNTSKGVMYSYWNEKIHNCRDYHKLFIIIGKWEIP